MKRVEKQRQRLSSAPQPSGLPGLQLVSHIERNGRYPLSTKPFIFDQKPSDGRGLQEHSRSPGSLSSTTDGCSEPTLDNSASEQEVESTPAPESPTTAVVDWEGVTTLMIKNLPFRCTHAEVVEAIHDLGFGNDFESLYVPFKHGPKQNLGYAFVNLRNPEVCAAFRDAITGYTIKTRNSTKALFVLPPPKQRKQDVVCHEIANVDMSGTNLQCQFRLQPR
jgi:hypothetical protein